MNNSNYGEYKMNTQEGDNMFTYSKFSEMPGFLEYKEALARKGVDMGDRMLTFNASEDMWIVKDKMNLSVLASKYFVRDYYVIDDYEMIFGPKDPNFVNAKVVQCEALFGYDEQAIFRSTWQWILVNDHYFNDFDYGADCYWCSINGTHARDFRNVMREFNNDENDFWKYDFQINTTTWTDSIRWILWMPEGIVDCLNFLNGGNQ